MKKIITFIVALMMVVAIAGCTPSTPAASSSAPASSAPASSTVSEASSAPASSSAAALSDELQKIYDKLQYKPVPNTTGKQLKIAVLCVMNNSFWFDVLKGIEDIQKLMADPQYNTKVDLISIEKHDGQLFAEAIDNAVTMQYDAICTVGTTEAIIPAVNRASDANIPVYTFNCDVPTSKRVAFVGQDLYAAGVLAGETMAQLIGKKGKVAIITGFFNVPGHENRRLGAHESFKKYPDIEIIGEVEDKDSNDAGYSYTKDFITAHPDLAGIYITAGGQQGVTKALSELNIKGKVKVVMFDFMQEVIDAIYDGNVQATIGQDPYAQGANPVVMAETHLVKGKAEYTGNMWTQMDVVTKDNVAQMFPR